MMMMKIDKILEDVDENNDWLPGEVLMQYIGKIYS